MDGTLYEFKRGSFKRSGLYGAVINKTLLYISKQLKKTKIEAREILDLIMNKYGNSISIGLEKEFHIDRYDYFNFAWDIEAEKYVRFNEDIKSLLNNLKKNYNIVLLSDAPVIWINRVLEHLRIKDIFENRIFSGEGDARKELSNAFEEILKKINTKPCDCIVVGDQVNTDIVPAKKVGARTVYIGKRKNKYADYTIKTIFELKSIAL